MKNTGMVARTNSKWSTIRIPMEVRERIKELGGKTGKVTWEVILEAVTLYESFIKRPSVRQSMPNIDKLSWYITKVATSFGAFKENPSEENFQYLVKRVEELKDRLGVDAELLLRMAEYYRSAKDEELKKKIRIDLNAAFKQVVKDLIVSTVFELVSKED